VRQLEPAAGVALPLLFYCLPDYGCFSPRFFLLQWGEWEEITNDRSVSRISPCFANTGFSAKKWITVIQAGCYCFRFVKQMSSLLFRNTDL
jgi:hypothetical protein